MRFLFVDRITSLNDSTITGTKTFNIDAPMQYDGYVAPGVISEAIGQLASWLCIKHNDFSARPVFLFADKIEIQDRVRPGQEIILSASVTSMDRETFVFSGTACVDGKLVQSVTDINGYFMPLGDLEDPEVSKDRFAAMTNGGLSLDGDTGTYDFNGLIDQVQSQSEDSITTEKLMRENELFFLDHFPRFPVTPIVMINEMIGQASKRLLVGDSARALVPTRVDGIKIRNFVKPGEQVETKITVKDRNADTSEVTVIAQVLKNKKPILRGQYTYRIV